MLVFCDVTLYNFGSQCTNDLMNAPCCFSTSTPEGLHDDKLLLVERRHAVVLRDSFCLTQMNLKPKNIRSKWRIIVQCGRDLRVGWKPGTRA